MALSIDWKQFLKVYQYINPPITYDSAYFNAL